MSRKNTIKVKLSCREPVFSCYCCALLPTVESADRQNHQTKRSSKRRMGMKRDYSSRNDLGVKLTLALSMRVWADSKPYFRRDSPSITIWSEATACVTLQSLEQARRSRRVARKTSADGKCRRGIGMFKWFQFLELPRVKQRVDNFLTLSAL